MKRTLHIFVVAGFMLATMVSTRADEDVAAWEIRGRLPSGAGGDGTPRRNYAPDRLVEVLHLALDVTPDFRQRTISGKATIHFQPLTQPVREIRFDAVKLRVQSLTATEKV